jgi:hypothetical protein
MYESAERIVDGDGNGREGEGGKDRRQMQSWVGERHSAQHMMRVEKVACIMSRYSLEVDRKNMEQGSECDWPGN